ncbi:MAG: hypothetical protein IT462_09840 [Planctomycetes bacterium]|nr:hypothetical protein [Planctomycetota bacterium]
MTSKINGSDPIIDAALAELIGGLAAPDLSARILARAQAQPVQQPQAVEHTLSPWRSRMFMAVEFLAAAAVLGVIAWLVWFSEKTPAANTRANVESPSFVTSAPDAEFQFKEGVVEFKRGWLMVETGASIIRAADTTITDVHGRAVLKDGAAPTAAEIETMRQWLKENRVEEAMLKNAKRWLVRGAIALCVLSGSVVVDGVTLNADGALEVGPPEVPEKALKATVFTPSEVEKLDENVTDLICGGFRDADVPLLKRLAKLRNLDISARDSVPLSPAGNHLTDEGLAALAEITTLRVIDLSKNRNISAAGIAKLATLPHLDGLNLSRTNVTGAGIKALAASNTLRELDIEDSRYAGNNPADDFKTLADYPALRSLGLVNCDWVNDAVLQQVGKCARLDDLNLHMSRNFGDEGVKALAGLSNLSELRAGGSSTIHIRPGAGHVGPTTALDYLNASAEAWGAALRGMGRLRLLHLDTVKGIDDSVLTVLGGGPNRAPGTPLLTDLRLHNCCNISDAGIVEIQRLPLRVLDVSYCGRLTDEAMASIARISGLRELTMYSANQALSFGDRDGKDAWLREAILNISDKGLAALTACEDLETLDIGYNHGLTADGLRVLPAISPKTLRCLILERLSGLTDAVVNDALSTMTGLRHLDVSYCENLTDAAVDGLAKLTNLERLLIARTYNEYMFSQAARKRLQEALPRTILSAQ